MGKLLKEVVQPKKPKGNPAKSALETVQQAIEQLELQKDTLEHQLETAKQEIESVKGFRDDHVKKIETWKVQDEYRRTLRQNNPDVQVTVAPWDEYKAALGEVLVKNFTQKLPKMRIYFIGDRPNDETRVHKILGTYKKHGVEVYSLTGTYPSFQEVALS